VADSFVQVKPEELTLRQNEERERQLVRNAPVAMFLAGSGVQESYTRPGHAGNSRELAGHKFTVSFLTPKQI
jgi:hypothetical protein